MSKIDILWNNLIRAVSRATPDPPGSAAAAVGSVAQSAAGTQPIYGSLPRAAVEHIVVVGGPSNPFNGFGRDVGVSEPPLEVSDAEVTRYLTGATTHDLFWGNFLLTAVRLFRLRKITPDRGDVATVIVFLPPYQKRIERDWRALNAEENSSRDDRINRMILERLISPDAAGVEPYCRRRPTSATNYLDLIHKVPERILFRRIDAPEPALLPGCLVKVLLATTPAEILDYLATGAWSGEHHSVGEGWQDTTVSDVSPTVNRCELLIGRLDYVGHSARSAWFLQYGVTNDKGRPPNNEVEINASDLQSRERMNVAFSSDALSVFWGCRLGQEGGMAQLLAPAVIPNIIAAIERTDFDSVLTSSEAMPTSPSWLRYPAKTPVSQP